MSDSPDPVHDDELLRRARVRVIAAPQRVIVRLSPCSPFMSFLRSMIVGAILLAVIYVAAAATLSSRAVPPVYVVCGVVLAVAVSIIMSVRRRVINESGAADLIIDMNSRTISLPRAFGRAARLDIPLDDITAILPAEAPAKTDVAVLADESFGARKYNPLRLALDKPVRDVGYRQNMLYAVVIMWRTAAQAERMEPVVSWYDHPRADAFAHWLSLKCNVDLRPDDR